MQMKLAFWLNSSHLKMKREKFYTADFLKDLILPSVLDIRFTTNHYLSIIWAWPTRKLCWLNKNSLFILYNSRLF